MLVYVAVLKNQVFGDFWGTYQEWKCFVFFPGEIHFKAIIAPIVFLKGLLASAEFYIIPSAIKKKKGKIIT